MQQPQQQAAAIADPCEASLTQIFDDSKLLAAPSDTLIRFIDEHCVTTAKQTMASKCPPPDPPYLILICL